MFILRKRHLHITVNDKIKHNQIRISTQKECTKLAPTIFTKRIKEGIVPNQMH